MPPRPFSFAVQLSDIIREVGELGLQNARLDNDYKGFVNRAVKAIAERRNWSFLHDDIAVVMPAGANSVALPANFKCLSTEKSPVTYIDTATGRNIPIAVKTRQEIERQLYYVSYPYSKPLSEIFLEINQTGPNAGLWALNLPNADPNLTAITFTLSCFTLPADLVLGTDSNAITNHGELCEAVINKTKALAYFTEDPSDKRGMAANQLYEMHFKLAGMDDARRLAAGRSIHM